MTDESRFAAAVASFEAVHRQDPSGEGSDDTPALRYHRALAAWVGRQAPGASEAMRLAAHCQHLRRWSLARSAFAAGAAGYKKWRATLALQHADDAAAILGDVGYDPPTIARVRELLLKKRLRSDPEVGRFEDAICLTFMELQLTAFARAHPADKVVGIIRKTWAKMTPAGHAAAGELSARLPPDVAAMVTAATQQPA